jgi:hypothetical protein
MCETPWSPKVKKARDCLNILKHLLGMYHTWVNMSKSIEKLCSKAGRRNPLPALEAKYNTKLCKAQQTLKQTVKAAAEHQREDLEDLAESYALREDKEKSVLLKYLIKAEEIKAMYAKIRAIRKNQSKQGISTLEVPIDRDDDPKMCTHWQTVNLPEEILELLQKRNQAHFRQAKGTPFTIGMMRQAFGFAGSSHTSELVLNGNYTNEETDAITSAVIRFSKKDTTLDAQSWPLTEADFLGKIRTWKESTSTSPSGVNLSHYHALWQPFDKDPTSPEGITLATIQAYMVTTHVILINYALRTPYVYDRWKDVVNIMILKETSNNQIHRLYVFHLYEADYNLILGMKWRDALHHGEDNQLLN